jgi:hypothetical protein
MRKLPLNSGSRAGGDNLLRGENRRVPVEGEGREGVTVQGHE